MRDACVVVRDSVAEGETDGVEATESDWVELRKADRERDGEM